MKQFLILFFLGFFSISTFAQSPIPIGGRQVNAGLGIFSKGSSIYAGMDFGLPEDITVGGEISLQSRTDRFPMGEIKYSGFGLGANANYHFNRLLKLDEVWDVYGGLILNYVNWGVKSTNLAVDYTGQYEYTSGIGVDIQIGGRYYFNQKIGINLELGGLGISRGKLGISYRL